MAGNATLAAFMLTLDSADLDTKRRSLRFVLRHVKHRVQARRDYLSGHFEPGSEAGRVEGSGYGDGGVPGGWP